ncbi:MAG: hypothetical protein ACJARD_000452 [Alphaproteobacteria bacterium]|jgi:hypothetical protein
MLFNTFSVPVTASGITGLTQLKRNQESQEEVLKANSFVKRETDYFKENINKISSAEEFVDDTRLLRYGLAAYGLEEELFKTAFIRQILESDVTDEDSAINRISDPRWQSFAAAFIKPTVDVPGPLQDGFADKQIAKSYAVALDRYKTDDEIDALTSEAETFRTLMKDITSAEDLVKPENSKALDFIKQAFGVEGDGTSNEEIVDYLTLPAFSAIPPEGWQEARSALSFFDETNTSISDTDKKSNSDKVIEEVVKFRFENELKDESGYTEYTQRGEDFRATIRGLTGLDDLDTLLADEKTMTYLKEAYNLGNDTTDTATIKSYLTSETSDNVPTVWNEVRELLNFGDITDETPYVPATFGELSPVIAKHKEREVRFGSNIDKFDRLKKEADNFRINIGLTADNGALVNNSRVLRFAMSSFGISTTTLDSQKALNVLNNDYDFNPNLSSDKKLREFQKAYSFTISGNNLRTIEDDIGDVVEDAFVEQTFISAVGNSDPDLRLALYFENRITDIASQSDVDDDGIGWLRILGEQPLATAFQRVFSLPTSIGTLDLDQQKEIYADRAGRVLGDENLSRFSDKAYRDDFINLFLTRSSSTSLGFDSSSASIAITILNGGG